jgi:hypothetical protein
VQHGEGLHCDAGGGALDALGLHTRLDAAPEDCRQEAGACKVTSNMSCNIVSDLDTLMLGAALFTPLAFTHDLMLSRKMADRRLVPACHVTK